MSSCFNCCYNDFFISITKYILITFFVSGFMKVNIVRKMVSKKKNGMR